MTLVRLVVVLFGATYIASAMAHPYIDGDLFWQHWLGQTILHSGHIPRTLGTETFAAVGAPWIPQEWLFSVLYALAERANLAWLFYALVGLSVALTLAFVAKRAERLAGSFATLVAIVLCGIALDPSLGVRAQNVGWLGFSSLLLVCDYDDNRRYWAIPIVALWANIHASAVIAVPIVAIDLLVALLQRRSSWRLWIVLIGVSLALCVGPLGVALPLYALQLGASPIRQYIVEWQAFAWMTPSWYLVLLPMLAVLFIGFRSSLAYPRELLRAALLLVMSCLAVRNVALFAIVAAPLLARSCEPLLSRFSISKIVQAKTHAFGYSVVSAIFVLIVFVLSYHLGYRAGGGTLPFAAIEHIEHMPGQKRLFCTDFAWCSIPLGAVNMRVYLDGRADPFPLPVWRRYLTIVRGGTASLRALRVIRANVVLADDTGPLAATLDTSSGWQKLYADSTVTAFIWKVKTHINPPAITKPT